MSADVTLNHETCQVKSSNLGDRCDPWKRTYTVMPGMVPFHATLQCL